MRMKPGKSPVNSTPLLTSVATLCGSSSVTGIHTKPAAASVWRPLRVALSISWALIMATARRQRAPSSPKARGIRCQSTLWALFLLTTVTSSWLYLLIAFRNTPSSSLPATTPQLQSAKPSCAMSSHTLVPPEEPSPTAAESSLAPYGPSSCAVSGSSRSSLHLTIPRATRSRGATAP